MFTYINPSKTYSARLVLRSRLRSFFLARGFSEPKQYCTKSTSSYRQKSTDDVNTDMTSLMSLQDKSRRLLFVGLLAFSSLSPLVAVAAEGATAASKAITGDVTETTTKVDEIVVVAHKNARSIRDVAATVSVFAGDNIRFELGNTIADVFRYAPGIDFESAGTRFGAESINIRGISGNRVAVLIDGVPLSDQYDVGSFSNATRDLVNAGLVDAIEVLRGPASALYGSAAIGGVVAMRTPDPERLTGRNGKGGTAFVNHRSDNNSAQATAMQAFSADGFSMLIGGSLRRAAEADAAAVEDNLDQRDSKGRSALLRIVVDDPAGNTWRAGVYHQHSDVDSSLESMLGSGRFRSTTALQGRDEYQSNIISLEYLFSAGSLIDDGVLRAYFQQSDIFQETYDERGAARRPVSIDRAFSFEQASHGFEANLQRSFTSGSVSHQLGFGLEFRQRQTEEYRDGLETDLETGVLSNVLLGEVFPLRDFPISETTDWGAYLEDTVTLGDWSVIAALRADLSDMRPDVDAMYLEDYPFAQPVDISDSELSPKLGLIYRPAQSTEIWLQYAHGFRAPPYEDANISLEIPLFNYRAIPNPDLRPERSDGIDMGLRWRGTQASADISVFRTDYEDFIESRVRLGPDPDSGRILFQAQNIARATIEGVEAGASIKREGGRVRFDLEGRLYWARGEDGESGEALNSVGPPQAVISLSWSAVDDRWRTRLQGTLTDDWSERDESGGALFQAPGHAVIDLFLARRVGESVTLRAGVSNLLDRTCWAWTDIRGLAPDDPTIPYLSRPGRSFTVGLDMNW